jgi:hypothetical protein
VVAFANFAVLLGSLFQARETIAIAFAIRGRFIVFAHASTQHGHGRDCESVKSIAIAWVIRGREKSSQSLFANFAVSLRLLWRFAEVIAVAFCDLAELL